MVNTPDGDVIAEELVVGPFMLFSARSPRQVVRQAGASARGRADRARHALPPPPRRSRGQAHDADAAQDDAHRRCDSSSCRRAPTTRAQALLHRLDARHQLPEGARQAPLPFGPRARDVRSCSAAAGRPASTRSDSGLACARRPAVRDVVERRGLAEGDDACRASSSRPARVARGSGGDAGRCLTRPRRGRRRGGPVPGPRAAVRLGQAGHFVRRLRRPQRVEGLHEVRRGLLGSRRRTRSGSP